MTTRRQSLQWIGLSGAGALSLALPGLGGQSRAQAKSDLIITELKITPVALADPPILAASGCHGPYFLRNILQIKTRDGVVGIGETHGGADRTKALEACADVVLGKSAFGYRRFRSEIRRRRGDRVYAGVELACLDAIGRATGLNLSRLLGGPVRDEVEFAAYLFFRYAADDPRVLNDPRLVDNRGKSEAALDHWGEVRTPDRMAEMAEAWRRRWGFRHFKLKAGVLPPDVELAALRAMHQRLGGECPLRIDPNGRWSVDTAIRIGKTMRDLPLEYYEDPVRGQKAMAKVRQATGHVMSTNSCVTSFDHIPAAVVNKPIDVVLCDHHFWGGIAACQSLGHMAEALGWGLSQHSNNHCGVTMAAMIHLGAVVPQLTYPSDTHYPHLPAGADIIDGGNLPIVGGKMKIPQAPGVGVSLDEDKLAQAHETHQKCGMRRRDDAATMRRFVPGWERAMF